MKNWIEEGGIPHDNGKIKWYVLGTNEFEYEYLGEYDMNDWDKAFDVMFEKAQTAAEKFDDWNVFRKDHVVDMMWNIACSLRESGDFKEEWLKLDIFDEEI